ncbi:hypothetical protein B0H63DRAFT_141549 [Podospora didyma]|uniref:Cytochrome b5 heme-binding domain-containing protein n=1 Tax=Podospora didyma TaxID=330526 RepID=A0AAE0NSJ8_9PEZI|nr:hypothetical protein B0H63DRAFT_141549 [Podospora didyma]
MPPRKRPRNDREDAEPEGSARKKQKSQKKKTARKASQRSGSPWRDKYGQLASYLAAEGHSGFGPILPRCRRPFGIRLNLPALQKRKHYEIPSNRTLDWLFSSELAQIQENRGLSSYYLGCMSLFLPGEKLDPAFLDITSSLGEPPRSPPRSIPQRRSTRTRTATPQIFNPKGPGGLTGGVSVTDLTNAERQLLVEVKEREWHPIFHKKRWYDWRLPIDEARPRSLWSVDNRQLWKELQVVIEMANNFLEVTMRQEWLSAFLFGDTYEVDDEIYATRSEAYQNEENPINQRPRFFRNQADDVNRQRVWDTLERYAYSIVWTFVDYEHENWHYAGSPTDHYGLTEMQEAEEEVDVKDKDGNTIKQRYFASIKLNITMFESLLRQPQSVEDIAERYLCRMQIAYTIVHELMHAISVTRYIMGEQLYFVEPMYDGGESSGVELAAELGFSWEKNLFGQAPRLFPQHISFSGCLNTGMPWPGWLLEEQTTYYVGRDNWLRNANRNWFTSVVPTAWSSELSTANYWATCYSKYGQRALRMPERIMTPQNSFYDAVLNVVITRTNLANFLRRDEAVIDNDWPDLILESIARNFDRRKAIAERLRPWAEAERKKWSTSPYSKIFLRGRLEMVVEAIRNGAEGEGDEAYKSMLAYCNNFADLESRRPGHEGSIMRRIEATWTAIVYLLAVARRFEKEDRTSEPPVDDSRPKSIPHPVGPSKEAKKNNTPWIWPTECAIGPPQGVKILATPNVLSGQQYNWKAVSTKVARLTLLDHANKMIKKAQSDNDKKPSKTSPLIKALIAQHKSLKEQVEKGADEATEFLTWTFALPEYDPTETDSMNTEDLLTPSPQPGEPQESPLLSPGQPSKRSARRPQTEEQLESSDRESDYGGGGPDSDDSDDNDGEPGGSGRKATPRKRTDQTEGSQAATGKTPRAVEEEEGTEEPAGKRSKVLNVGGSEAPGQVNIPTPAAGRKKPATKPRPPTGRKLRAIAKPTIVGAPSADNWWTIGEVGNHRAEMRDLWVLVNDESGTGFDIYAIDGTLVNMRLAYLENTRYGYVAEDENIIQAIHGTEEELEWFGEQEMYRGKLILPKTYTEVAEMDGQDGRPWWVNIEGDIFDFTTLSDAEWQTFQGHLEPTTGGWCWNPKNLPDRDFLVSLAGYRCATVQQIHPQKRKEGPRDDMDRYVFTLEDVYWMKNPQDGMWFVVDDDVYDLSSYCDEHPGGTNILKEWAGRDASVPFREYHQNWEEYLEFLHRFKMGRIVPARRADLPLSDGEILHHYQIYSFTSLQEEDPSLYEALLAHERQDITNLRNRPWELRSLIRDYPELVIAHVQRPRQLKEITLAELAQKNQLIPGPVPEKMIRPIVYSAPIAWISIDDVVYDVSDLMEYGDPTTRTTLLPYVGRVCPPVINQRNFGSKIAHECRAVGRLVVSKQSRPVPPPRQQQQQQPKRPGVKPTPPRHWGITCGTPWTRHKEIERPPPRRARIDSDGGMEDVKVEEPPQDRGDEPMMGGEAGQAAEMERLLRTFRGLGPNRPK